MQGTSDSPGFWTRARAAMRESPPLLWAFIYFFCLLTGYYVLRPVREAMGSSNDVSTVFPRGLIDWFASRGVNLGDYTLPFLFTCTFLIMLFLQPVYGALVSRYPRRVFLPVVYGFFIATLLLFFVAFHLDMPGRGMAYFLWITVFNLFAVTVFWSFMADVFDNVEAKRFYGYIGAAGTLGALLGPLITGALVQRVGVANLMLVCAGFLLACIGCQFKLRRWAMQRERERGQRSGELPIGGQVLAGLKLVATQPLLRAIATLVLLGIGVGTLLYNEQAAIARVHYPDEAARTAFFARIDLAVNGLALVVQLLVTRLLLSRFGIAPALMIPGIAIIIGYSILTVSPLPVMIAIVQVVTRASEFSLAKPARETIYTRVNREWRYKAGAAIDTVIYRAGDLTFVWVHKFLSAFGSNVVFGFGLLLAAGMTFGAWRVVRAQSLLGDGPRDEPPPDAPSGR